MGYRFGNFGGGFGGFGAFGVLFGIAFLLIVSVFVAVFVKGISQWNKNNHSPRLSVPARVAAKRDEVHHRNHDGHHHTSSTYYVTFEVESGDRMELQVAGQEFGMLVEEDAGMLTFQGTRYLGFERTHQGV